MVLALVISHINESCFGASLNLSTPIQTRKGKELGYPSTCIILMQNEY
jgi:hypothetical protein